MKITDKLYWSGWFLVCFSCGLEHNQVTSWITVPILILGGTMFSLLRDRTTVFEEYCEILRKGKYL